MIPPILAAAKASPTVVSLLKTGNEDLRFHPFGEYTQDGKRPYAVWQTVYGQPENLLACTPSMDRWGVQVDVFALDPLAARAVFEALVAAVEPVAYIVGFNGEFREDVTRLYRISFTVEFMTSR